MKLCSFNIYMLHHLVNEKRETIAPRCNLKIINSLQLVIIVRMQWTALIHHRLRLDAYDEA